MLTCKGTLMLRQYLSSRFHFYSGWLWLYCEEYVASISSGILLFFLHFLNHWNKLSCLNIWENWKNTSTLHRVSVVQSTKSGRMLQCALSCWKKAAIKRVNKRPQSPNGFTRLTACTSWEKHRWGNCKIEYSRSRWKVRRVETCTSLNDARGGLLRTKKVHT